MMQTTVSGSTLLPMLHEAFGVRRGRAIESADDRRRNDVQVLDLLMQPLRPALPDVADLRAAHRARRWVSRPESRDVPRPAERKALAGCGGSRFAAQRYAETFTLEFEVGQPVFIDQADQFAQLIHVNGSFQMLRQRTMPAPTAIALGAQPAVRSMVRLKVAGFPDRSSLF